MKDSLSKDDWKKWGRNVFIFAIPALLAFLTALQTGNFMFAIGALYQVVIASLIDLLRKYSAGVDPLLLPNATGIVIVPKPNEVAPVPTEDTKEV
jgi:hypothetical protein